MPGKNALFYILSAASTAVLFVAVQVVALLLVPQYESVGYQAFGKAGQTDPLIPLIYVAFLIIFSLFLIYIFKKGRGNIIRVIFIFIVSLSAIYVLFPVFLLAFPSAPNPDFIASVAVMIAIAVALWLYPEWYVVDSWGFIMAAGITAIFGISLGILPSLVLLIAMATYDFVAVYKTRHMLDIAEGALDLNLPVMMMVPRKKNYSNFGKKVNVRAEEGEERDALFIGLGDMIIPGVLTVSSFANFPSAPILLGIGANALISTGCIAGALVGFALLMRLTSKGKAQAGLPLLNTGTIAGFLIATVLIFHTLPLHYFL